MQMVSIQIYPEEGIVESGNFFSDEELCDLLIERRLEKVRLNDFRNKISLVEQKLKQTDGSLGEDPFPLKHEFADGMYIRQITMPAKSLVITKIHKQTHPFFVLKGKLLILTEDGIQKVEAPYSGITKVGTKRIIWCYDEVVFTTVHSTKEMDIEKIESEVIAKDFRELDGLMEQSKIENFISQLTS